MVELEKILKLKEVIDDFVKTNESSMIFSHNYKFKLILLEAADLDMNKFNLFLSADWIDNQNSYELTKKLFTYLRANTTEDIYLIVRAIIFVHTTDKTVQYVNTIFNFNNQPLVFIPSLQVGDNLIENAYLLNPHILEKHYA